MRINWNVFRDLDWPSDGLKQIVNTTTLLALIGFITTSFVFYLQTSHGHLFESSEAEQRKLLQDQMQKSQYQIAALESSIQRSNEALSQVLSGSKSTNGSSTEKDITLIRGEITSLKSEVAAMHTSLDALNSALLTTPDKALSIPLLRKDLEDFRVANQRDVDSIRLEMGRAYELNKWLMGFLLAAVLGMIINNLIQSKSAKPADSKAE